MKATETVVIGIGVNHMEKILIQGASVVNGSGDKTFIADVAIVGDFIAEIGRIPVTSDSFTQVINARGLTLTPGFIDMPAPAPVHAARLAATD